MSKKISITLILLNLGAAICLFISLNSYLGNFSPNSTVTPHESLLNEQIRVESEYLNYMDQLKETVVSVSLSKDVQKLRRGSLRKKYFLPRKADVSQSTLRYASYTVKKDESDIIIRPVYETFKSKLFWDKLLKIMARQALVSTDEMKIALHPNGGEKFTEIISIFLKDAGLANLEYPGNFSEFSMLGEDILLYWDIVYKKCSSSIRKTTGSTQCVKGIFTGEIDRLNSVRDFALNWQENNNNANDIVTEFGQIKRSYSKSFIEAYWPSIEHSNRYLGENINKFLKDRGCRFFREGDKLALIRKSQILPDTLLVSKVEISGNSNLTYSFVAFLLLILSILISVYFIKGT
ncbi:MAG: hypothetical protein VX619_08370 [bacterium]|nr:hypothetical protein [bacterium]